MIVGLCREAKHYALPALVHAGASAVRPSLAARASALHDDVRSRIPVVSDVHINQGWSGGFRVNGRMQRAGTATVTAAAIEEFLSDTLAPHQTARLAGPEKAAISAFSDSLPVAEGGFGRIRIKVTEARNGFVLAIRLLSDVPPLFDELYLPDNIPSWLRLGGGLILFSGDTGSGKTTALGSCVRMVMEGPEEQRILTFEDPIEYIFDGPAISQYEVGVHVPSYGEGVGGVKQGDADLVIVQEFRDASTIQAGLQAAEQGNLVLGTIHAKSPPMVPDRIIAEFPPGKKDVIRAQLAGSLIGIVGMDLIPTRTSGIRRAACEVMDFNRRSQLRSHILSGKSAADLRNDMLLDWKASGCCTKEQSLKKLVAERVVEREVARSRANPMYLSDLD